MVGWAQALGIQRQRDGLGGAQETSSWQWLKRYPRVSSQVLDNQLVLQGGGAG